nr:MULTISPECIES: CrcB family protein [Rhizobium/Agrobacterium group]
MTRPPETTCWKIDRFGLGAAVAHIGLPQELRLFLTTGILGGFTTFSTFSLDAVGLWERGEASAAILYASASVILAFIAMFAGMVLVRGMAGGQTA